MIIITDTGSERVHITAPTERHSTGEVLLRLVNSASKQAVEVSLDVQEDTGYCIDGYVTLDALTGGPPHRHRRHHQQRPRAGGVETPAGRGLSSTRKYQSI